MTAKYFEKAAIEFEGRIKVIVMVTMLELFWRFCLLYIASI